MCDGVRSRWPYLSLLPDQGGVPPCRAVGGVNTIIALVVRVPLESEGPDGNPEAALSYEVSELFSAGLGSGHDLSCPPKA